VYVTAMRIVVALLVVLVTAPGGLLAGAGAGPPGVSRVRTSRAQTIQDGAILTGQLLVATDSLRDPRFVRTVIYMVRHDGSGAMGVVVNRPGPEVPVAPLLRQLGLDDQGVTSDVRLNYGGPVEPDRGLMLHTVEYATEGTERIRDDIALTSRPGILADIARGTGPHRYLFALGYAGWGAGQLEAEIAAGYWITVSADPAIVFDDDATTKWDRATARRRVTI
jgi:putative transcriptional regulator